MPIATRRSPTSSSHTSSHGTATRSVVDLVAEASEAVRSTQLPLHFQGGNVLIGDDFVLIGRDYLDRSVKVAREHLNPSQSFLQQRTRLPKRNSCVSCFVIRSTLIAISSSWSRLQKPPGARCPGAGRQRTVAAQLRRGSWEALAHIPHRHVRQPGRERWVSWCPNRVLVGDPSMADKIMGWDPVNTRCKASTTTWPPNSLDWTSR